MSQRRVGKKVKTLALVWVLARTYSLNMANSDCFSLKYGDLGPFSFPGNPFVSVAWHFFLSMVLKFATKGIYLLPWRAFYFLRCSRDPHLTKVINIEREHPNFSSMKLYQCHWVENHPFVDQDVVKYFYL